MSENVKNRSRSGSRRTTTDATAPAVTDTPDTEAPATDTPVTAGPVTDTPATDVPDASAPAPADTDATDATADEATDVPDGPDVAVGWADAVPFLALRMGSAPTAAEVRFAPMVWAMLQQQPDHGRTALQMAADAELDGIYDLDPAVIGKVLTRYERAGVVTKSTHNGRLMRWSIVDPAVIVADARTSGRTSGAASGAGAGTGGGQASPAGGLRALVEAHLVAHPYEEFTPTQIGKALGGRSSGAVSNALEKLVELGSAMLTNSAPRRYQRNPDAPTAPADGATDATATAPADGATDGATGEAVTAESGTDGATG